MFLVTYEQSNGIEPMRNLILLGSLLLITQVSMAMQLDITSNPPVPITVPEFGK